jgi:hypothetical protein
MRDENGTSHNVSNQSEVYSFLHAQRIRCKSCFSSIGLTYLQEKESGSKHGENTAWSVYVRTFIHTCERRLD